MFKALQVFGATTLLAAGTFAPGVSARAHAQATPPDSIPPAAKSQASSAPNPDDPASTAAYATGKPLEMQSKEGFWGHMNPFARKKWVHRQVDPLKDRVNELDELQAKNANDIRGVDGRATAGVHHALSAADAADAHAADAGGRADRANSLAVAANGHVTSLNGTVANLDQYQAVTSAAVPFAAGRTALGPRAKASLDELAAQLASEKGYIVEVQGYSRAGIPQSQAMADSVVRYLVTAHQVPIYRIYRTGLGKQTATEAQAATPDGQAPIVNGVRVTLLHNSLATMGSGASTPGVTPPAPTVRPGSAPSGGSGSGSSRSSSPPSSPSTSSPRTN